VVLVSLSVLLWDCLLLPVRELAAYFAAKAMA
jgi:hypothetical protein